MSPQNELQKASKGGSSYGEVSVKLQHLRRFSQESWDRGILRCVEQFTRTDIVSRKGEYVDPKDCYEEMSIIAEHGA